MSGKRAGNHINVFGFKITKKPKRNIKKTKEQKNKYELFKDFKLPSMQEMKTND